MSARCTWPAIRGAALLMCLLLLTALTLLGLAVASNANLQQRMAGNTTSVRDALRNADFALAWAEDWLLSLDGSQRPDACVPPCGPSAVIRPAGGFPSSPEHLPASWWSEHAILAGADPFQDGPLNPALAGAGARWLVEELRYADTLQVDGEAGETAYYRITARGTNAEGSVAAVAESRFARPWGKAEWADSLPPEPSGVSLCRRFEISTPCGRQAWRQLR